jgi:hypothetical protein
MHIGSIVYIGAVNNYQKGIQPLRRAATTTPRLEMNHLSVTASLYQQQQAYVCAGSVRLTTGWHMCACCNQRGAAGGY